MNPWEPDYWFLTEDEKVEVTLRETGKKSTIPQKQLLGERLDEWGRQNSSAPPGGTAWGMFNAEPDLTSAYTSNNEVTPLIDGEDFMTDLNKEIRRLGGDDFLLIAGWEFWQYRSLVKRVYKGEAKDDPMLLPIVLRGPSDRKAKIRVLAFGAGPPGCKERTQNFVEEVNKISDHSACLVAPTNFAMSHHQKEVLLATPDFKDSRAYVGGIDLAIHRWDDSAHNANDAEWGPGTKRKGNYGWHDIQVVLRGDALVQLWANFAERWADAKEVNKELLDCPVPKWGQEWKNRDKTIGKKHVQVLRTVGPASSKEKKRHRFMPNGERTVLCALKKAIEKATWYIYIEEQFLWDCELADFIAEKMNEKGSKLRLIIVMTAGCELPVEFGQYGFFLRDAFFRKILRVDRMTGNVVFGDTTRIYPYGLFQTQQHGLGPSRKRQEIYVHSKLIIIDDRYVAIGSANVDARSMHIETELTLGIVDGKTVLNDLGNDKNVTVCEFARDLRMKLWNEHSNLPLPKNPIEALKQFPGAGDPRSGNSWPDNSTAARGRQLHHLRCYINNPGANLTRPWMRRLIDRNERKFYQST